MTITIIAQRMTETVDEMRTMPTHGLSPLRGFAVSLSIHPTDESVGYCRVSPWDKDKTGVEA